MSAHTKHPAHLPVQIKAARDIDDNLIVIG